MDYNICSQLDNIRFPQNNAHDVYDKKGSYLTAGSVFQNTITWYARRRNMESLKMGDPTERAGHWQLWTA